MATSYIVTHFTRDPLTEAREAEREAERWRVAMRMATTDEAEVKYKELAEYYQDRAADYYAQVKAGQR